jgi:hypothetical protein
VPIAPVPFYNERDAYNYERYPVLGANSPIKGPLRFEEGIATDTDVPNDFARGAFADTGHNPTRINQNVPTTRKLPEETMQERAHLGSAAWEEAPAVLSDFVQGAGAGQRPPEFERVTNPLTTRQYRRAATVITD